jgi:hypothetical protein
VPIHNSRQINKSTGKPNICQVATLHLVRPDHIKISQKVWVHFVLGVGLAGVWFRGKGLNSHFAHQPLNPFAIDFVSFTPQNITHLAGTIERMISILKVNASHYFKIFRGFQSCRVFTVIAGTRAPYQFTLPLNTQTRILCLNTLFFLFDGH